MDFPLFMPLPAFLGKLWYDDDDTQGYIHVKMLKVGNF